MFISGRSSYVLATLLTLMLHAGLIALLIRYHDQLAALQLSEPKHINLKLVQENFEPLEFSPVQSRLIVEKQPPPEQKPKPKPKPKSVEQKKTKQQPKQKKQKKDRKSTKSSTPKPKKEKRKEPKPKPDPIEEKIEKIKQQQKTTQLENDGQPVVEQTIEDTPEVRIAKRYVARIQKQIEKNWTKPLNVQYREMAGLKVLIRLTLSSGGYLENAQIIQSSGNNQFDRSAMNAVFKTKQFQVPGDVEIFDKFFRQVTISYNL